MSSLKPKLIVQKYGGATLSDPAQIKQAAQRIFNLHRSGVQIVVVVSAMGKTTNQLIELAHQVSARPMLRELDMLLTVGERISMSLLSMALNDLGCSAISFTGSQAGIITDDSHVNANIIEVKAFRVEEALKKNKVVILAGFQGVSEKTKEITTLGRGGSDITAVAMAGYLNADRCEILKDVDCVYTADPKLIKKAKPILQLNYQHLLEMTSWGAKVLHHRSVQLASEKNVSLYVGPANDERSQGTLITHQISFQTKQILAINSFSKIFEIELNYESDNFNFSDFQLHLQKNQIGHTQLLHSKNKFHYFTAPEEILSSISESEKTQKIFTLKNKSLASVSITFSQHCENNDLLKYTDILMALDISIYESFKENHSLHFFVNSSQKNAAIEALHNLI